MSSRSLAAARSRRAGENAPPVSGNRPVTSIGGQAAFAQQQMPPGYKTNMPPPPNNVRISSGRGQQQQSQPSQAYQQVQQSQQQAQSSLPFSKISISDAIGLITLRLGRVEQWIIETDHENEISSQNPSQDMNMNIPNNSKIVDNSVFSSIVNRLEAIEKMESKPENISQLSDDIKNLTEQLTRIGDEGIKHGLTIAKHTEQLFRFERELVETKDILKTFMIKYDVFADDTNNKFSDFEYAISELEKNVQLPVENNETVESEAQTSDIVTENVEEEVESTIENNTIMSVDLKNIIKQELAFIST
jgi:hypothetical protein